MDDSILLCDQSFPSHLCAISDELYCEEAHMPEGGIKALFEETAESQWYLRWPTDYDIWNMIAMTL